MNWVDRLEPLDADAAAAAAYKSFAICGKDWGAMTHPDHPRIASDPDICGGKPTVAGTRVRVTKVLAMLAEGVVEAEILADFPSLTLEDVRACLAFAATITGGERIPPGYYTPETLPPLSPGAAAIIASVDAVGTLQPLEALKADTSKRLRLRDAPFAPLSVSDPPLPGYDPDA